VSVDCDLLTTVSPAEALEAGCDLVVSTARELAGLAGRVAPALLTVSVTPVTVHQSAPCGAMTVAPSSRVLWEGPVGGKTVRVRRMAPGDLLVEEFHEAPGVPHSECWQASDDGMALDALHDALCSVLGVA